MRKKQGLAPESLV